MSERVNPTLMFISPRGVISYNLTSDRAMCVILLMWIRSAYKHNGKTTTTTRCRTVERTQPWSSQFAVTHHALYITRRGLSNTEKSL